MATQLYGHTTLKNAATGQTTKGRVIARDKSADLALILTERTVPYVRCSLSGIKARGPLRRFAYGGIGRFVKIVCNLLNRNLVRSQDGSVPFVQLSRPSQSGDSGGGVFNSKGELVAVLHSTTNFGYDGRTMATETPFIARMVYRYDTKGVRQVAGSGAVNVSKKQFKNVGLFRKIFGCQPGSGGCLPFPGGPGNPGIPDYREPVTPNDLQELPEYQNPIDLTPPSQPPPQQYVQPTPPPNTYQPPPQIIQQAPPIDLNALADILASKMPQIPGPTGPPGQSITGPPGQRGPPGQSIQGPPGKDAVVDYERIRRDVLQAMPRNQITMAQIEQKIGEAIQAALDQIAANPPELPSAKELARQIQPELDPITVEFRDPVTDQVATNPRTGEPMTYTQKLGGKFVFRYRPSSMSLEPVGDSGEQF